MQNKKPIEILAKKLKTQFDYTLDNTQHTNRIINGKSTTYITKTKEMMAQNRSLRSQTRSKPKPEEALRFDRVKMNPPYYGSQTTNNNNSKATKNTETQGARTYDKENLADLDAVAGNMSQEKKEQYRTQEQIDKKLEEDIKKAMELSLKHF